jgi:ferredoxin
MVKIDTEKCIGCGMCVSMNPEIFEMDENGKAKIIFQKNAKEIKEIIESCPVEAIKE